MYKTCLLALILSAVAMQQSQGQATFPGGGEPASTPGIFAPGILSDGLSNIDFTISPDGDEIFLTLQQPRFWSSTILHLVKRDGQWSQPEVAPFSGRYRDLETTFSPDGKSIYFSSDRPVQGDKPKDFDIWKVRRKADGNWGEPENLGPDVNSDKDEFYPAVAKNGDLYFTTEAAYGKGSEDIVVCKWTNGRYAKPEDLPENVNTKFDEFNAFVDPDERFIIFSCYGRPDDLGRGDLYISHKDANGNWVPAKHLPAPVNSPSLDYCPYVTSGGKYLVFTSNRPAAAFTNGEAKTYPQLLQMLTQPGNGNDDLYWVKFDEEWLK
ncbi:MAG: PD40 domain-containing protein [Bacteroidetes bacterium]|nr:PD40 domain-containing protein [Bacteroidota bacterium]